MSVFGRPSRDRDDRPQLLDGVEGPAQEWLLPDGEVLRADVPDDDLAPTPGAPRRSRALVAVAALVGLVVGSVLTFLVVSTRYRLDQARQVAVVLAAPGAESAVLSLADRSDRDHPVVDVALRLHNRGAPVTYLGLASRSAAIDVRDSQVVSGSATIARNSSALLTVALVVTCPSIDNDSAVTLRLRDSAGDPVTVPADLPDGVTRSARSYACLGVPGPVGGVSVRYATGVAQLPATVLLRLDVHNASDHRVWVIDGASSGLDDVTLLQAPVEVAPGATHRVTARLKLEACPLQSGVAPPQLTLRVTATAPRGSAPAADTFDIRVPSDLPLITTYLQAAQETCLRRAQQ